MMSRRGIHRSEGRKVASWEFLIQTSDESRHRDKAVFDALMVENFPEPNEPPVYHFKARLNEKESKLSSGKVKNLDLEQQICKTLPELWNFCRDAAATFENLEWKKVLIVGFDYRKGSHDFERRSDRDSWREGRNTEINFDFVVAEQAGKWFRVYNPDADNHDDMRLQHTPGQLLSGMNCSSFGGKDRVAAIHILPYDEKVEAQLALLRDRFHQLIDALSAVLTPTNIHKFLEGVSKGHLLTLPKQEKPNDQGKNQKTGA